MCLIDEDKKSVSIRRFEREMAKVNEEISRLKERINTLEGKQNEKVHMHFCSSDDILSI